MNLYTVKVSFLARDRERDREREFTIILVYVRNIHGDGTVTITRQERNFHCIQNRIKIILIFIEMNLISSSKRYQRLKEYLEITEKIFC